MLIQLAPSSQLQNPTNKTMNRYFFLLPKSTKNYPTMCVGYKQKTPQMWGYRCKDTSYSGLQESHNHRM